MMSKEKREAIKRDIRDLYPDHGARPIVEAYGVSQSYVTRLAWVLGVRLKPEVASRISSQAQLNRPKGKEMVCETKPRYQDMICLMQERMSELEKLALFGRRAR